jgi:hypothetical protein
MSNDIEHALTLIAVLVAGDRWFSADAFAVYSGMGTLAGKPNRRGFLECIACRPDFPKANPVRRSWKNSEIDE